MKNIIKMIKKYQEIILYLIFGVLTTIINIGVFYVFNILLSVSWKISNLIAWLLSILFAFFTNKLLVFNTKKRFLKEFVLFILLRIISLFIDMFFMYIIINNLQLNELVAKIIVNVIIIIINYFLSKLIVFKKGINK